jgi:hypothetical protein
LFSRPFPRPFFSKIDCYSARYFSGSRLQNPRKQAVGCVEISELPQELFSAGISAIFHCEQQAADFLAAATRSGARSNAIFPVKL